jgi:phage terminase Nu1 subunit (DNA packaging protein)
MKRSNEFRFTATRAAIQWGLDRKTLNKRLCAAEIVPGKDGKFSIRQIDAAVHGDKEGEEIRLIRAKREAQEMANEEMAGNLVDLAEYRQHSAKKIIAAKQGIMSKTYLTDEQKDDILTTIANAFTVEHPDPAKRETREKSQ